MRGRRVRRAVAALLLLGALACTLLAGRSGGILVGRGQLLAEVLVWSGCAVGAALLLRADGGRGLTAAVLLSAAVLQGAALTTGPQASDDLYRYLWDAHVAASGVDPYAYAPDAPELRRLRIPFLWPDVADCSTDRLSLPRDARASPFANFYTPVGCNRLNRSDVRTIYPPGAQLAFRVATAVTPDSSRELQVEAPAAVVSLALTGLLVGLLRRRGRPPGLALLYAASPLAGLEAAMDAHVDVLAALLGVAALAVGAFPAVRGAARRWVPVGTGLLLAAGALVKVYPAALGVVLLPQWGWPPWRSRRTLVMVASGAGLVALAYLPHVLAVGPKVVGFAAGYLKENGYGSGSRYLLLSALGLDGRIAGAVAALLLLALLAWALRQPPAPDLTALAQHACVLLGGAFLVLTPGNAWYCSLLIGIAVLADRAEWSAVVVANHLVYFQAIFGTHTSWPTVAYVVAAVLAGGAALWRRTAPRLAAVPA